MQCQIEEDGRSHAGEFAGAVPGPERAAVRWVFGGVFLVIAGWLGCAAVSVQIEYFDGFSAIANARYFLGRTDRYVADRAPMMALLLIPAEMVRAGLNLHPLDVRPHHALLAVLHMGYLLVVYRLLRRAFGPSWFVLAAWGAAIPNFMFFSYSPFVSHDLLPGALLLGMLLWRDRFATKPSIFSWLGLVALGAIAALVKQTFGIFWILLLSASLFQCCLSKRKDRHVTFVRLACGAVASGAIVWLVLGSTLANADPHSPLLIRPLHNLQYLSRVYEGTNVEFPLWIYLRNCPAFGWLAVLLVLPGWAISMRGTRLQQSIAIAWLSGLVFLHILPLREVRYMAFLAPLTACLLVPAFRALSQQRTAIVAAMLVLSFDAWRCGWEAAQVFDPFYTSGIQKKFFDRLDDPATRERPVLINAPMLNFVSPTPSPLAADRYHRIFHFGIAHLRYIYNCRDLRIIADERSAFQSAATCSEGSLLYHTNQVLARGPSWAAGRPFGAADFTQGVAVCRSQAVELRESAEIDGVDSDSVSLVRPPDGGVGPLTIQGQPCGAIAQGELLPMLRNDSTGTSYWLRRTSRDSFAVPGMRAPEPIAGSQLFTIRWFEIDRKIGVDASR